MYKIKIKSPEYSLVACDLSAAEVRTATNASGDPDMIKAYQDGMDLYSLIASKIYNNKYEDNLEFYPEGTKITYEGKEVICGKKEYTNKAGKVRRQDSKSVLIGLIYGRGANSIAEQISDTRVKKGGNPITKEEAQQLIDNIYKSFPRLKEWMEETHDFVHKNGYIDDIYGRRRRLPDAMLSKYSITLNEDAKETNFNPILGCPNKANEDLINTYLKKLDKKYLTKKEYDIIKKCAKIDGLDIQDNTGRISQAERQSVNFQAQAASSEINKLSMITIDKDPEMKNLGVQLLLTIHDEVIVQCPTENAEKVAELIPIIMTNVAKDKMVVPLVADSTIIKHWYQDDVSSMLNENFNKYCKGDLDKGIPPLSKEEAINKLINEHSELLPEQISNFLNNGVNLW